MEPLKTFFYDWPRNFVITSWIEALVAQPIVRFAMVKLHAAQARSTVSA
ncbi:hypothetical protein [Mesobacillus maritimus]